MKLLFVVHRYAPFPGGSEYYVQAMTEEALSRGHEDQVEGKRAEIAGRRVREDIAKAAGSREYVETARERVGRKREGLGGKRAE